MINQRKLSDRLTDMFIGYQYRLDNPMPHPYKSEEEIIHIYRSDHIFNRKVQTLVGGVMQEIGKSLMEANND